MGTTKEPDTTYMNIAQWHATIYKFSSDYILSQELLLQNLPLDIPILIILVINYR